MPVVQWAVIQLMTIAFFGFLDSDPLVVMLTLAVFFPLLGQSLGRHPVVIIVKHLKVNTFIAPL